MTNASRRRVFDGLWGMGALAALLFGAPAGANNDKWGFSIEPYLWGPGIEGTIGINGRDTDVDAPFSDLLEFVDIAGSLRFEAAKGNWGAYGDIWFAALSNEEERQPLGKVKVEQDMFIGEAGGLYRVTEPLDVYFGLRAQTLDVKISFENVPGPLEDDVTITDAIVGARYRPTFGERKRWGLNLRGDIGTGDSDVTWLAQVGVSYRFSRRWYGAVAYRYLQTDYDKDDFKYDIALQGFGIGAAYRWGGGE